MHLDTVYQIVTYLYWIIVLYFTVMLAWELVTEKKIHMQIAIALAMIPFLYRLFGIK